MGRTNNYEPTQPQRIWSEHVTEDLRLQHHSTDTDHKQQDKQLFLMLAGYLIHENMGKCKFNEAWMDNISFHHWLKTVVDNIFEAFCTVCKKRIQLRTMGVKALDSHTKSTKHMKYVQGTNFFHHHRVSSS